MLSVKKRHTQVSDSCTGTSAYMYGKKEPRREKIITGTITNLNAFQRRMFSLNWLISCL